MNHNPHNFKVGDSVLLDNEDTPVKIEEFTPSYVMAKVSWYGNDDAWWVMTNRLTPPI